MGALLQFFSNSPLLQRIRIHIHGETLQDIPPGQVTSLDSLVEMNYSWGQPNSILPFLRLPRLKQLRVSSSAGVGEVQRLDDILPHGGRALLAQATRLSHYTDLRSCLVTLTLSGNGVEGSFTAFYTTGGTAVGGFVDWFSSQAAIPFGQIEELIIGGSPVMAGFGIDAFALENLKILRVTLWDGESAEAVLRPFHPVPQMGVPCQSLREMEYTHWDTGGPFPTSLISLVEERKQAGCQLELFRLGLTRESDRDLARGLRKHVLQLQVRAWDERT
jgi:hypothetical protein